MCVVIGNETTKNERNKSWSNNAYYNNNRVCTKEAYGMIVGKCARAKHFYKN